MKWLNKRVESLIFKFSISFEKGKWDHIPLHLDYSSGKYRQGEIKRLVNDSLPHFALTPAEFDEYTKTGDDGEKYRLAWSRISKRKKSTKGDYGELIVFLILKVFFKSEKLVTKVKLKTGNQEVYGYDCAHFTVENDEPVLWLGESKFHSSFSNAIGKAFESLEEHCKESFITQEFSFLEPHIELNEDFPFREVIREKLKGISSFDSIKIKVPVFITYDCSRIKNHKISTSPEFLEEFKAEFQKRYELIEKRELILNSNFELIFIVLPLESVEEIKNELDTLEQASR